MISYDESIKVAYIMGYIDSMVHLTKEMGVTMTSEMRGRAADLMEKTIKRVCPGMKTTLEELDEKLGKLRDMDLGHELSVTWDRNWK
jgi:predicted RecB family nuclease